MYVPTWMINLAINLLQMLHTHQFTTNVTYKPNQKPNKCLLRPHKSSHGPRVTVCSHKRVKSLMYKALIKIFTLSFSLSVFLLIFLSPILSRITSILLVSSQLASPFLLRWMCNYIFQKFKIPLPCPIISQGKHNLWHDSYHETVYRRGYGMWWNN